MVSQTAGSHGGIHYGIGLGSSGSHALAHLHAGLAALKLHPLLRVVSVSRAYGNAAVGGATHDRFCNAAVVVQTALSPAALLRACFAIESACGRVRVHKNGARTLDLDLLWSDVATSHAHPTLPHPRLLDRAFALVPLVEALERARVPVPLAIAQAAVTTSTTAQLEPVAFP